MQFFEDFLCFGALLLPTMLKIFRALRLAGKILYHWDLLCFEFRLSHNVQDSRVFEFSYFCLTLGACSREPYLTRQFLCKRGSGSLYMGLRFWPFVSSHTLQIKSPWLQAYPHLIPGSLSPNRAPLLLQNLRIEPKLRVPNQDVGWVFKPTLRDRPPSSVFRV